MGVGREVTRGLLPSFHFIPKNALMTLEKLMAVNQEKQNRITWTPYVFHFVKKQEMRVKTQRPVGGAAGCYRAVRFRAVSKSFLFYGSVFPLCPQ